ncbi:MAG: DUF5312 family protein [Spirochaetes bacterium]|nr:DUF5312 family protein [Spirochaetota bacterium]
MALLDLDDELPPPTTQKTKPSAESGFMERILSFFMGIGDPEAERKKQLKLIARDLQRSQYKFYRPKSHEALPQLARFFYEAYKVVAPAQVLLDSVVTSGTLRSFVIESFLSKEQRALSERLTDEEILERANTVPVKELSELVKQDIAQFISVFDGEKTNQIDSAYNTLISFVNFTTFDFYFLLKKFDSSLAERSFSSHPKFETISADYVSDDIHDFLEVFLPLNLDADWKRIFEALKEYRHVDVIQVEFWLKLVPVLKSIRQSQVLDLVVRHAKGDPGYTVSPRVPGERIVEPFVDKLRNQVELLLQKITQERRNAKIDELSRAIFGTSIVVRMKNYTDKANIPFAKKMLGGFTQTVPLNFLRAFLMDYLKKDVREQVDHVIVRGQWSTNLQSQQLSDAYHSLLDVSDAIVQFDDAIADDGETGSRLHTLLMKSDRDKEALKYLRQLLKDINDKALGHVNKAALNLIAIGRYYKGLIDDLGKPHHEVVLNWKEVETAAGRPMREWMIETYKRIYYMVQLLQYYIKGGE